MGTSYTFIRFALLCFAGTPAVVGQLVRYRMCVPHPFYNPCQQMSSDMATEGGRIDCVPGNDKIDCIGRVTMGEADFLVLEPEEFYVAHKFYRDPLFVISEIRAVQRKAESFDYETVAVVRKASIIRSLGDLGGKRSCHTAFGRTTGWEVPISSLMQKAILKLSCSPNATTTERELQAVSQFFSAACAPGQWVSDPRTDQHYKKKYANLCQLCRNPRTCQDDDPHAGFKGSLRCLTERSGDVAWTRLESVYKYLAPKGQKTELSINTSRAEGGRAIDAGGTNFSTSKRVPTDHYAFLCPDGTQRPLDSPEPCTWAGRPWRAFMVSRRLLLAPSSMIADLQVQISKHQQFGASVKAETPETGLSWLWTVLEFSAHDIAVPMPPESASKTAPPIILGNYSSSMEKPICPDTRPITFCATSGVEKEKCAALKLAALGRRIQPPFDCVLGTGTQDCMRKISEGQVDVMAVDAMESYVGSKQFNLKPILFEAEGLGEEEEDGSRFGVAVVRADSGIYILSDLKGKRSCHGSVSSLTGWNMPITVLRDSSLIPQDCNAGHSLADFFSGSCIPGANEPDLRLPKSLCSICVGAGLSKNNISRVCSNNELESFYGDFGALRCLQDGAADVAFVEALAPLQNELQTQDFRLVCPRGPSRPLTTFRECHWGKIPPDQLVISGDTEFYRREEFRLTLMKLAQIFHPEQTVFSLFGSYNDIPNQLFRDTSTGFTPLADVADSATPCYSRKGLVTSHSKGNVCKLLYVDRIIRSIEECTPGLADSGQCRNNVGWITWTQLLSVLLLLRLL